MLIGERIRVGRRAKRMSQTDLARALSTTAMTVSRWERGISEPQTRFCRDMARVFEVSLDWLVAGLGAGPDDDLERTGT